MMPSDPVIHHQAAPVRFDTIERKNDAKGSRHSDSQTNPMKSATKPCAKTHDLME